MKKVPDARRSRSRSELFIRRSHLPEWLGNLPNAPASYATPMKCLLVQMLPEGPDWLYEIKLDGIRAIAVKTLHGTTLYSRTKQDLTLKYPSIAKAVQSLSVTETVLDGEVVALDEEGRSSFQLLQSLDLDERKPALFYYVFDLLNVEGKTLLKEPLERRKQLLGELIGSPPRKPFLVRFSAAWEAKGTEIVRTMKARGLEGLIAKRKRSIYQPGKRGSDWAKYKWVREQEFVIGGFTPPSGSRHYFGALLIGYYQGGQLLFASKVGGGFNEAQLRSLHQQFQPLISTRCPFVNLPERRSDRRPALLALSELKRCTWLKPILVCRIKFAQWTRDGHLRQPIFQGMREDVNPMEVVREQEETSL